MKYGLHKHHIFNGNGLRNWSEKEGLWIYLSSSVHMQLHDGSGLDKTYKRIGQHYYEKTHTREEFMKHSDGHKNYLTTPLTDEEKTKYGIDYKELDLSTMEDIEKYLN